MGIKGFKAYPVQSIAGVLLGLLTCAGGLVFATGGSRWVAACLVLAGFLGFVVAVIIETTREGRRGRPQ
jgi:hypothetical protein